MALVATVGVVSVIARGNRQAGQGQHEPEGQQVFLVKTLVVEVKPYADEGGNGQEGHEDNVNPVDFSVRGYPASSTSSGVADSDYV
ncbi:MAG: hypothetical protein HYZ72_17945 [Deltaproteobacteria bacterium]|nr:hypothetical protein [Deltaproteobacteria bacterium]